MCERQRFDFVRPKKGKKIPSRLLANRSHCLLLQGTNPDTDMPVNKYVADEASQMGGNRGRDADWPAGVGKQQEILPNGLGTSLANSQKIPRTPGHVTQTNKNTP